MSDYTPTDGEILTAVVLYRAIAGSNTPPPDIRTLATPEEVSQYMAEYQRWLAEHDAKVRVEAVEYAAQLATDTLRMCQAGGVGEKNILPLQQEVGFQLCIDNIENLAKSMKEELK